ncbi:MAG: nucleotidyltransferase domain-containing protein, partial [Chloroflexi bacterium]|nr:nucleotidyltransferase domain-containing protein [Chloroflexota bacterium]
MLQLRRPRALIRTGRRSVRYDAASDRYAIRLSHSQRLTEGIADRGFAMVTEITEIQDTTQVNAAIAAMAARLRDDYGAEAVILYGSRADGSARPNSDIDLMIIKSDAPQGFFQTFEEVNSVLSDIKGRLSLDARVYAPEQVERTLAIGDHFV